MPPDIFFSYTEADSELAFEIATELDGIGYTTWLYEKDSVAGISYIRQTMEAISRAKAFLILITPNAIDKSQQMTVELIRAHEDLKPIIPVRHGIQHAELSERQPEWRHIMGATASVGIGPEGLGPVIRRIEEGLRILGIEPEKPVGEAVESEAEPTDTGPPEEPSVEGEAGEPAGAAEAAAIETFSPAGTDDRAPRTTGPVEKPKAPRRWAWAILVLLAAGLAVLLFRMYGPTGTTTPQVKPPVVPKTGRLTVVTVPPDSRIELMESELTYAKGMNLPAGEYRIRISLAGYEDQVRRVTVESGQHRVMTYELTRRPGRLWVDTDPPEATITVVDGPAYSPGMELPEGRYDINVSHPGYEAERLTAEVTAGKEKRINAALTMQSGTLTIVPVPAGAGVEITDPETDYQAGMPLKPGQYAFRVTRAWYEAYEGRVDIRPNEPVRKDVRLKPAAEYVNTVGMKFVRIPGGTFDMGSPPGEAGRSRNETRHSVTISRPLYVQATEVTQGQWKAVMGDNPSQFTACGDDCPVERVTWAMANEFIGRLNDMEGDGRYRLPTEAEWEYASRAGSRTALANGPLKRTGCETDENLDRIGWYCANSGNQPHPAARKAPNAWGLYDMHGNVWEWCQDWYGVYGNDPQTDPKGPETGVSRIGRGGSWKFGGAMARSARRTPGDPSLISDDLGFRVVREAEPDPDGN